MRLPASKIPLLLALAMASTMAISQGNSRLLPQSITDTITSNWKRDGRVIDIGIASPSSKWVVEELTFEISYKSTTLQGDPGFTVDKNGQIRPSKSKSKTGEPVIDFDKVMRVLQLSPTTVNNKIIIQPGKSANTHIELNANQTGEVENVRITEARGREQTTFERLSGNIK